MKAILQKEFGGAAQLYIGDTDQSTPKENEVLVKVHAAGINRADILQREGKYPPPKGASDILGLEIAGEVVSDHSGKWKVGDRVFGLLSGGGYAQYVSIHEDMLMPIPYDWSFEEAAAIPETFLTAYQALVSLAELQSDETILIHTGGSGVGTAAIQIAKQLSAEVTVTASANKHEACTRLGADHCIDYKSEDFTERVSELTNGQGVNVVLDFIAAQYFKQNLKVLSKDGRMVMLAFLGGIKVPETNLVPIISKRLKIMGSTLRSRSLGYQIKLTKDFYSFAYNALEKGTMRPVIDTIYPWTEVQQAHEYMEANKNIGKLILKVEH